MNHLDAFHHTVHNYPGGPEALAPRLGMSAQVLRNKANVNSTTNKPTLDEAARVMTLADDFSILHAMAEANGFVLTKLDDQPASDMAVLENVTNIWQRMGDLAAEVQKTLADGRVEPHEVDACGAAAFKAVRPILQLIDTLDGMSEKRPAKRRK